MTVRSPELLCGAGWGDFWYVGGGGVGARRVRLRATACTRLSCHVGQGGVISGMGEDAGKKQTLIIH